jgi:hypothetical protein
MRNTPVISVDTKKKELATTTIAARWLPAKHRLFITEFLVQAHSARYDGTAHCDASTRGHAQRAVQADCLAVQHRVGDDVLG